MNQKQRNKTITFAVCGGAVIAVFLLVSTIWVLSSARDGTDRAVNRVSEFYLEELAGRRALTVSEELNEMWVHSPPLGAQANFNRIEKHDTM